MQTKASYTSIQGKSINGKEIHGVSTYMKMKTQGMWQKKEICHVDMKTLEDQLEAFRRCSMELIDLEITKWAISSLNGKTREIENVLSTNHQRHGWWNWPRKWKLDKWLQD